MEPIECSKTSAISTQTLGKHPKENILHLKHDESLKSRKLYLFAVTNLDGLANFCRNYGATR
jgi:hypothetical protein